MVPESINGMGRRIVGTRLWALSLLGASLAGCATGGAEWPQWGGPDRNFMVECKGLAESWPEDGPARLWSRELGDGYSTIVADNGRLYTMYRTGEDEVVIAMDADSGKTIWEHRYEAPFTELMAEFGPGPHSTPLVVGDRLYTVGTNMIVHCFDKDDGDVLWKRDLVAEFEPEVPPRGYASSPLAYKDTIILPVGGNEGQSLVAFNQYDGSVVWKNQSFEITYSSPILIHFGGEDHLVAFMAEELIGVDPDNGELLWRHPHKTQYGANLATPLWTGDDLIFVSAAYDSGSRVIRLSKQDDGYETEELWYGRKLRIHHGNAIRIGDYVYGSSGDFGPAILAAVNVETGDIAWRKRGFAKATMLYADGRIILLDEDGKLALLTVTPEGMTVHSQCQAVDRTAWAAPTLVGKTLYVRDRKTITALDLG